MTDKELNMTILDQLYVIADAVWAKMEKVYEGSFTAAHINSNIEKLFWWGEVDRGNLLTTRFYAKIFITCSCNDSCLRHDADIMRK